MSDSPADPPKPVVPWALRRGVSAAITIGVITAAVAVVLAVWLTRGGEVTSAYPSGIRSVAPVPGAQVPRQSPIGVRLEAGWEPTLTIGGKAIPRSELDAGTIQLGEFLFAPGPGKAIEELRSGQTCARVIATPVVDVKAADIVYEWCFNTF